MVGIEAIAVLGIWGIGGENTMLAVVEGRCRKNIQGHYNTSRLTDKRASEPGDGASKPAKTGCLLIILAEPKNQLVNSMGQALPLDIGLVNFTK